MRRVFCCLFLLIFSFQVLPVKELVRLWQGGTFTENVQDSDDASDDDADDEDGNDSEEGYSVSDPELLKATALSNEYLHYSPQHLFTAVNRQQFFHHTGDVLPPHYVPEPPTPPPNFV